METTAGTIYPNLFIMFVGRPGVGKSLVIGPIMEIWKSCPLLTVGSQTITYASFIDELKTAFRERTLGGRTYKSSAILLGASEFGSLTSSYDQTLLTRMADIYDGRPDFDSSTRGDGIIKLTDPLVHLLVGITPKFLGSVIPDTAWQQGFMARMHIIYSDEETILTKEQLFSPKRLLGEKEQLKREIIKKIIAICHFHGEFSWDNDAAEAMYQWNIEGRKPVPGHPKLETYCVRRFVHTCKLAMIIAAASQRHTISLNDFTCARMFLLESEETLAETFSAMSRSSDTDQIDQIYHWLILQVADNPLGVTIPAFHNYLASVVGIHMLERMYNHLEISHVIHVANNYVTPGDRQNV